tara:strand:- start:3651 stop:4217 length:567 start_codon:yes stop_codon:yes gene_type:complete
MDFTKEKQDILNKEDKSIKKEIDFQIKPLIDLLNSLDSYYTTSSCSGRISLLEKKSDKKIDTSWLYCSHDQVEFSVIKKELEKIQQDEVWFRFEPAILHVCCKTIEHAQKLIDIAKEIGFKRTGIQATRKKIMVEINSSEIIYTLIANKNNIIIDDAYLQVLIDQANKKMQSNIARIDKLNHNIKSNL